MTPTPPTLSDLVERVKSAEGPDLMIDGLIEVEARRIEAYRFGLNDEQRAHWRSGTKGVVTDGSTTYYAYTFTRSIDAALALVERLCGDNWYSILLDAMRKFGAAGTLGPEHLPRYILAALLSALQSSGAGEAALAQSSRAMENSHE